MTQNQVSTKIASELIQRGIVQEKDATILISYLDQAYAAGQDELRQIKRYSGRKVKKVFADTGETFTTYDSVFDASRKTGINQNTLRTRIKKQIKKDGYIFEYIQ